MCTVFLKKNTNILECLWIRTPIFTVFMNQSTYFYSVSEPEHLLLQYLEPEHIFFTVFLNQNTSFFLNWSQEVWR